jgi:putative transposase
LRVTDRGYRAWRDRPMSQRTIRHEMLAEAIANIHRASRGCYGVRRVHAELVKGLGIHVGRDQVGLIMSRTGLRGISGTRRRYVNREHLITAADLVNRRFTADRPNQLWCTDITEHPTREGKVYCCCVIDVHSRKIVGWAIDTRQTTNLVLNALDMAVENRKPSQTVIHSDHGTQFTSWAFTSRIREAGLVGSMGTIGDGYDNAMIESFWGTMQVELLNRKKWRTRLELANAIFEYIEGYYNRTRRHSALNWESPSSFEAHGQQKKIPA